MSDIKRIDINEFHEVGFLQEANRQFFHPLGLALEIVVEEDGSMRLGGVWDYREDPEGMIFGTLGDDAAEKAAAVQAERVKHAQERYRLFYGDGVVELDDDEPEVVQPLRWVPPAMKHATRRRD